MVHHHRSEGIVHLGELQGARAANNASATAPVVKKGARTGNTIGQWNQIASSIRNLSVKNTPNGPPRAAGLCAAFITPPDSGTLFAMAGDSGSLIFDVEGRAAGLLFALQGQGAATTGLVSYAMPMHLVGQHIEACLQRKFGNNKLKAVLL